MNNQQTQLIEGETGFRALFDHATVGILVLDIKGHIERVNPFVENLFGYTKEELIGQPVEILMPESFRQHHVHYHKGYFRNPKARPMGEGLNLLALKKDGTTFAVEISLAHYELDNKKLAVAFINDISQRKKAIEALKTSEENYKNLFKNSVVSMHTTDEKTFRPIDCNDMAVKTFGYASKEDFLNNYHPKLHYVNLSQYEKNVEAILNKGEIKQMSLAMKKCDGTCFWANLFLKLNKDKNFIQAIVVDVTEQVHFQEALEAKVEERTLELTASLSREKELNEMKSRFVSMASHEFRTPLTAILSSISLIEAYTKEEQNDKRKKHTERVKSSIKNLMSILNDFLSLEKLEQGATAIHKEMFDLNEFSKDILEEINGMLKTGQRIKYLHNGENGVVQDKKILKNVFLNLLSNAIKYSGENKEIHFTIDVNKDSICIKIKDDGMGIPEEEQKYLFTKFYRASNVTNIQGTGLGLNIVKRYVELLDGTISFESKMGFGTTFILEFP